MDSASNDDHTFCLCLTNLLHSMICIMNIRRIHINHKWVLQKHCTICTNMCIMFFQALVPNPQSRKVLIVRMSWDDPPPPNKPKELPGQQDQGYKVVHHDQREGYNPNLLERGVSKYLMVLRKFHILVTSRSNTIS